MAKKVGYVELPDAIYKTGKEHLQQKLPGTCYLTEDGSKRSGTLAEVYKKENLLKVK